MLAWVLVLEMLLALVWLLQVWGLLLLELVLRALAVAVAQWGCRLLPGLWWRPVGSCPAVV